MSATVPSRPIDQGLGKLPLRDIMTDNLASEGTGRHLDNRDEIHADPIRKKLAELISEHRDLDDVISSITHSGPFDQLQIQRLKKRKLILKDQISKFENQLLPDIIA